MSWRPGMVQRAKDGSYGELGEKKMADRLRLYNCRLDRSVLGDREGSTLAGEIVCIMDTDRTAPVGLCGTHVAGVGGTGAHGRYRVCNDRAIDQSPLGGQDPKQSA
jgi:hypothetical protein